MKKLVLFLSIISFILISFFTVKFLFTNQNKDISNYSIEELQDLRRVDGIVEPVFTQDCFPRTLKNQGVSKDCFERANLADNSHCSSLEIEMIKKYYEKGQENDPLNDGSNQFCADW